MMDDEPLDLGKPPPLELPFIALMSFFIISHL
jgi:hypothetical protein